MINKYDYLNKAYDKCQNIGFMDFDDSCLPMYATAYVKFQRLNTVYNPAEGLEKGTIFPELFSPYQYNPMF